MQIEIASDASLLVRFGESASDECFGAVTALFRRLRSLDDPRIRNIHPAYATVLVDFDPLQVSHAEVGSIVNNLVHLASEPLPPTRVVQIPICYGGEFGPDLAFVAEHAGLPKEEVVRVHSSANYVV